MERPRQGARSRYGRTFRQLASPRAHADGVGQGGYPEIAKLLERLTVRDQNYLLVSAARPCRTTPVRAPASDRAAPPMRLRTLAPLAPSFLVGPSRTAPPQTRAAR